ncbi:hypothetical protein [Rhizobium vallis]|uniref:hypothetical protein n=1 Tax=Rhizobium vallis TaxID=634290 RepID=UPI0013DF1DBE
MKVARIASLHFPSTPMGWVNLQHLAGQRVGPSAGQALAGKDQGMDAFVVNDGEFDILFERSFDDQPPHHRTLPDDARASTGQEALFGMPVARPARFCCRRSADVAFRYACLDAGNRGLPLQ